MPWSDTRWFGTLYSLKTRAAERLHVFRIEPRYDRQNVRFCACLGTKKLDFQVHLAHGFVKWIPSSVEV